MVVGGNWAGRYLGQRPRGLRQNPHRRRGHGIQGNRLGLKGASDYIGVDEQTMLASGHPANLSCVCTFSSFPRVER